ncbi:MAG: T9SS type A sorting domain-containing protein, partial [Gillisia sp.]|nr:T9SS type A sorting domain-containing protein [Gillisia sp.]
TKNVFNGALYFWDHFAGKSHILLEYVGGYATRNLTGGVPAASTDERINANDAKGTKVPGQFIPVAQGFFINSVLDPNLSGNFTVDGGDVIFQNSQRAFVKETNPANSQFLRPENNTKKDKQEDTRAKIRLDFISPMGYHRQILVGLDPNTSNGFDLGYDAFLNDNNPEDMFWLINGNEFVIQGVPNFELDQVLPLGVKLKEEGDFSIKINKLENVAEDVNIYLKNLQDSTYFDLRKADFTMKLEPGNYDERFQIVFQKEKISTEEPDPVEETEEETVEETIEQTDEDTVEDTVEETEEEEQEQESDGGSVKEEFVDGNIEVLYAGNHRELAILNPAKFEIQRVVIYDMLGEKIQEYQYVSNNKEVRLPVREFAAAVYVVKLYSGNKEISKNIILIR